MFYGYVNTEFVEEFDQVAAWDSTVGRRLCVKIYVCITARLCVTVTHYV